MKNSKTNKILHLQIEHTITIRVEHSIYPVFGFFKQLPLGLITETTWPTGFNDKNQKDKTNTVTGEFHAVSYGLTFLNGKATCDMLSDWLGYMCHVI